jgi:transcriptional regulator with XRE-family HTH domain
MAKKKITPKSPTRKPPTKDLIRLGARIRELRKEKGFDNFEHFAYEHGFSRAQFGRYEKGEDLRYSSLLRVVRALNMTMEEFFSEGFD